MPIDPVATYLATDATSDKEDTRRAELLALGPGVVPQLLFQAVEQVKTYGPFIEDPTTSTRTRYLPLFWSLLTKTAAVAGELTDRYPVRYMQELSKLYTDQDPNVRTLAALHSASKSLPGKDVIVPLQVLFRYDEDRLVRVAAALSLVGLGIDDSTRMACVRLVEDFAQAVVAPTVEDSDADVGAETVIVAIWKIIAQR